MSAKCTFFAVIFGRALNILEISAGPDTFDHDRHENIRRVNSKFVDPFHVDTQHWEGRRCEAILRYPPKNNGGRATRKFQRYIERSKREDNPVRKEAHFQIVRKG